MTVLSELESSLLELGLSRRYWIAFSGGLDSTVLLAACADMQKRYSNLSFTAIHIDHGLQSASAAWAAACQSTCRALSISCVVESLRLSPPAGESVEAYARAKRYDAFSKHLQAEDVLLTAHHQEDQAETFLLQLFRGAGIKGLSAMPIKKPLGNAWLVRPLLACSKATLLAYAKEHTLQWVEDPSNVELKFQRNYCRHEILPVIQREWQEVSQNIARSALHCANASLLLEEMAREDSEKMVFHDMVDIAQLKTLSVARQENLLRYWLVKRGLPLPSTMTIQRIMQEVMQAREDAMPCVTWEGAEVRRFKQRLYANKPLAAFDPAIVLHWQGEGTLMLPGELGSLQAHRVIGRGIKRAELASPLEIRFRQGGESCYLPGRLGAHSLKQLLQEWQVPTWQRDRIPLIYHEGHLIAVVGFCVCDGFQAQGKEEGVLIEQH